MFLSSMRTGVFSGVFLGILVLGGVGLILSDHGNFFSDGVNKTDVIVIDGHPIKSAEFDQIVRRSLQSKGITSAEAYQTGFIDRIVQNEVMTRLMRKTSFKLGIVADDKTVANEIHKALVPMGGDPKEALKRVLTTQGMSEKMLVETMRNDISTGLLRQTIGEGVYVPKIMTKAFYEWNLVERDVSYITLPYSAIKIDPPSDAELAKFYESIKADYTVPESRDVTVGIVDNANLAAKTEVTDEKVKAYYDSHKSDFETPAAKTLEQSVFKTEQEAKDALAAAKTSSLKAASGKTGSYNEAANFDEKSLPGPLSKPVFAAKTGDYVGPVETPLGWHVAHITGEQKEGVKSFDDVKVQIKKDLSETASSDALFEATSQIEDRLANGDTLQTLAEEYKIKLIPVKDIKAGVTEASALNSFDKDQAKILQAAFATNEKESSALSDLPNGKMFTVHVDQVTEAKAKDLKDVKADVTSKWTELEKRRKSMVKALDITLKLDEKKATLANIAKENDLTVKNATVVRGNKPDPFTLQTQAQLMSSDISKSIAIPEQDGIKIVVVDKVKLPSSQPNASELSNIEKNLFLDLQEERFVSFINNAERNSKVVINSDLIERMYGQTAAEQ